MANMDRRARFNPNPVAEVRSIPSPASSTSSLAPSPGPSTPPPLPGVAFSSPAHSPQVSMHSPYHSPSQPRVYTPSPIPQAQPLPFIPPPPLTPGVYLNPALAAPNVLFDMRHPPSPSTLNLSPAVLATHASQPPLPSLGLHPTLSPKGAAVTVLDVLLAIYRHLRTAVKANEYEAMSRSRKTEISQEFERRVSAHPEQRDKGLRRVDFLGRRFHARGLVRAQSKDSVWDVVIR
ncbi:hypothetical protein F5148DRAFT_1147395 [Russula earlei]|uniref:Uncharacterized protein n=1 Tax=Russula earlei TaxID=71964 RepID=A0ACC0UG04_9AGAM|nr:hypothetical protein F5148DRAFT_1147395 [Russula earlei]